LTSSGTCLELALPERVERAALLGLFEKLAALLRRPLVGASPWIGFALVASEQRLAIQLFCCGGVPVAQVRSALEAAIPGAVLAEPSPREPGARVRAVPAGFVLRPVGPAMLPLRTEHASDPARQILAALAGHAAGDGGIVQLLVCAPPRAVRGRARKQARRLRDGRSGSFWPGPLGLLVEFMRDFMEVFLPGGGPVRHGPTAPRSLPIEGWRTRHAQLLEAKASEPLLAASLRLAAFAADRRGARERLRGLVASFAAFTNEGRLRPGREPFFWPRLFGWLLPPVLTILRNRAYRGQISFRGTHHSAPHEPLVDEALFEQAQQILCERGEDASLRRSNQSDYLLTGLVRCVRCGKRYLGAAAHGNGGRYPYYVCFSRQRYGRAACDADSLPADQLEQAVIEQLMSMLDQEPLVGEAIDRAFAQIDAERPRREAEVERLDAERRKLNEALDRYFRAFEQGTMPEQACGERITQVRVFLFPEDSTGDKQRGCANAPAWHRFAPRSAAEADDVPLALRSFFATFCPWPQPSPRRPHGSGRRAT
jgi:hypothetical protein